MIDRKQIHVKTRLTINELNKFYTLIRVQKQSLKEIEDKIKKLDWINFSEIKNQNLFDEFKFDYKNMTPYVISQVQDLVSVYDVRQISEIILELNQVNIQIQTKDSEFYIKNNKKLSLISSEFEDYQLKNYDAYEHFKITMDEPKIHTLDHQMPFDSKLNIKTIIFIVLTSCLLCLLIVIIICALLIAGVIN
ncbi:conserved hypothetical protein [Ureaplasma parvum serovar 6 str. ATCC 27818]|uniref:hypothetical protein n=1 Tax=Ureaplasma parvum TaxID=134821 RepID=UPI000173BE7A|nr:hypothetical protein [Ureaplasma parvum]EDU19291.1 conserved hypothetical protein [Ureaplasma parvum serovar 6 str. ATCC 27818]